MVCDGLLDHFLGAFVPPGFVALHQIGIVGRRRVAEAADGKPRHVLARRFVQNGPDGIEQAGDVAGLLLPDFAIGIGHRHGRALFQFQMIFDPGAALLELAPHAHGPFAQGFQTVSPGHPDAVGQRENQRLGLRSDRLIGIGVHQMTADLPRAAFVGLADFLPGGIHRGVEFFQAGDDEHAERHAQLMGDRRAEPERTAQAVVEGHGGDELGAQILGRRRRAPLPRESVIQVVHHAGQPGLGTGPLGRTLAGFQPGGNVQRRDEREPRLLQRRQMLLQAAGRGQRQPVAFGQSVIQQGEHRPLVADLLQAVQGIHGVGVAAAGHFQARAVEMPVGILGLEAVIEIVQGAFGGIEIPCEHFHFEPGPQRLLVVGIELLQNPVGGAARLDRLPGHDRELGILVLPRDVVRGGLDGGFVLLQGQIQRPAVGIPPVQGDQARRQPRVQLAPDVVVARRINQLPQGFHHVLGALGHFRQIGPQEHDIRVFRVFFQNPAGLGVGFLQLAGHHQGAGVLGAKRPVAGDLLDNPGPERQRLVMALHQGMQAGQVQLDIEPVLVFGDQLFHVRGGGIEPAQAEQVLGMPETNIVIVGIVAQRRFQIAVGGTPIAAQHGHLGQQAVGLGRFRPKGEILLPELFGFVAAAGVVIAPAQGLPDGFNRRLGLQRALQQRDGGGIVLFLHQQNRLLQVVVLRQLRLGIGGAIPDQERLRHLPLPARCADQALDGLGGGRLVGFRRLPGPAGQQHQNPADAQQQADGFRSESDPALRQPSPDHRRRFMFHGQYSRIRARASRRAPSGVRWIPSGSRTRIAAAVCGSMIRSV